MHQKNIKTGTFAALFIVLLIIFRPEWICTAVGKLCAALSPIAVGIILAVALDPFVCRVSVCFRRFFGRNYRYGAIAVVYAAVVGVSAAAVCYVIPQLIESVRLLAENFDGYYSALRIRLSEYDIGSLDLAAAADSLVSYIGELSPKILSAVYNAAAGFVGTASDIIVGAVFSVYMLAEKERLLDFMAGIASSLLSEKAYRRTAHIIHTFSYALSSFLSGQMTEAVVLGTLCFFGMLIFGFEFPLLISVMIGITALVPVVGAFVGAIPSVLLLLLVRPASAVWFTVYIIVLQQIENNLIYPRIVGKSVGLPPILILAAIVIGGELGGVLGILMGIPILSAIYTLCAEAIRQQRQTEAD
ncbi:MAG: AI-2E family transporter [Oscillospiraceae bacterium]|nr:AI-2E family transporter [Oscillospiraceae bacterium]